MADEVTQNMVRDAIGPAIEKVIVDLEGGFTTKWVCIIESVEQDGSRGVWVVGQEDMAAWDSVGLLDYTLTIERARIAARYGGI